MKVSGEGNVVNKSPQEEPQLMPKDTAILEARQRSARVIWLNLVISAGISVGMWFVWRPLGATVAPFTIGYLRKFFSHYGDFWRQDAALLVGVVVGIGIAVLVRVLTSHAGVGWLGASWLGLLGFLSAGYIGYGTSRNAAFESINLGRNRATIGIFATITYVLALAAMLVYVWVFQA
jgi:hypothetical protein